MYQPHELGGTDVAVGVPTMQRAYRTSAQMEQMIVVVATQAM
jgi:hypothetical protein